MLGNLLRNRRQELGLDVQDIARMTGMTPKQIIALEGNHHATFVGGKTEIERLTKLYAKKLNMPPEASLALDVHAGRGSPDAGNAEVAIPAFLIATKARETISLKKRR